MLTLLALALLQSPLYVEPGDQSGDELGRAVCICGDLDGDGAPDFFAGAPKGFGVVPNGTGYARAYSGRTGAPILQVTSPGDFTFYAQTVAAAGDLDGDGIPDLLVGTRRSSVAIRTFALAYSGADGSLIHVLKSPVGRDDFGFVVGSAGDLDGDGAPDIAVGAPTADAVLNNVGAVFLFSGASGAPIRVLEGSATGEQMGRAVCDAGDLDGDGVPDLLVGSPVVDSLAGKVKLFSGADGTLLRTISGTGFFGNSIANAGDVDGDGLEDAVVGAPATAGGATPGMAKILSGATGGVLFTLSATLPGTAYGQSVSGAGDVNGDGRPDFLIGAPYDASFPFANGRVFVHSGFDGSTLFQVGGGASSLLGFAVAAGADLNLDGRPEILAGAPFDSAAAFHAGAVVVVSLP